MICPKCKCEFREGFYTCSTCEVDLISIPVENDDMPPKNKFLAIRSLFFTSVRISAIIITAELMLFLLLVLIKNFFDITSFFDNSYVMALWINGLIIPTFLLIYKVDIHLYEVGMNLSLILNNVFLASVIFGAIIGMLFILTSWISEDNAIVLIIFTVMVGGFIFLSFLNISNRIDDFKDYIGTATSYKELEVRKFMLFYPGILTLATIVTLYRSLRNRFFRAKK